MDKKTSTKFTCVRYGNVVWSTGSVFPIWRKMHSEKKIIGTTGPEMRRFFFTVDEAVELVLTALERIDDCQGKVLSRTMKAAQIEDILNVWINKFGGSWEKIDGRPGERIDEFLIGEIELPYTREFDVRNVKHFLISFNEKADKPLSIGLSSANTIKLTDEEIIKLISFPPIEE